MIVRSPAGLGRSWSTFALAAGALITISVILATLGPVESRPRMPASANVERAFAYAAMIAAYVFARPKRWILILTLGIAMAVLLELAQVLTASRHGTFRDAIIKVAGCGCGAAFGRAADFLSRRCAMFSKGTT